MALLRATILLLVYGMSCSAAACDHKCPTSANELQCVLKHCPAVYRENPEYFWGVLNRARNDAFSCDSVNKTAEFLRIVRLPRMGADLQEYVSEGIETLCVKQPVCFKKAMNALDEKTQHAVKVKLGNPIYFDASDLAICLGHDK